MRDTILGPRGMDSTGFFINESMRKRLAKIHHRGPDGALQPDTALELPQEPEFEMGGGGLYSTVGDYLKFAQAILHGGALNGARVLKPDTVELMCHNAIGDIVCSALKTAQPPVSRDVDFLEGMNWSLAFLINPAPLPTGPSAGALAWARPA